MINNRSRNLKPTILLTMGLLAMHGCAKDNSNDSIISEISIIPGINSSFDMDRVTNVSIVSGSDWNTMLRILSEGSEYDWNAVTRTIQIHAEDIVLPAYLRIEGEADTPSTDTYNFVTYVAASKEHTAANAITTLSAARAIQNEISFYRAMDGVHSLLGIDHYVDSMSALMAAERGDRFNAVLDQLSAAMVSMDHATIADFEINQSATIVATKTAADSIPVKSLTVAAATINDFGESNEGQHIILNEDNSIFESSLAEFALSDIDVRTMGRKIFRIEKTNSERVRRYDISAPDKIELEVPVLLDNETGLGNSHDLVIADLSKAYLLRYGKATSWIVNPSAKTKSTFKTGQLDFTAYNDGDGIPEAHAGLIVSDKLFVLLQRIDRNNGWTAGQAYVVVFDITTDNEIDTNIETGAERHLGIPLPIVNPGTLEYNPSTGLIYINGIDWSGNNNGGLISLDPTTYQTNTILDDDVVGHVGDFVVVDSTTGYFFNYVYKATPVIPFNPTNGSVGNALSSVAVGDLRDIALDNEGDIWIANYTAGNMVELNAADGSKKSGPYSPTLNPTTFAFVRF